MKTILLVGAGNMGFSMLRGWLQSLDDTYRFVVADPMAGPRLERLDAGVRARLLTVVELKNLPADMRPDAVVFATKPDGVCAAIETIHSHLLPETVLVSVAAGLQIAQMRKSAPGNQPIVRVMPNIGALIGQSASAGIASEQTNADQSALVEVLFRALGHFTWLRSEDEMHVVTAVSGSGPAYFFAMCEAMIASAIENGLSRDVAETLVLATCSAAGGLIEQTPNAALLREQVTSPGGTTAAGLAALARDAALQTVIASAIDAARKRSIEMA
ncbi:pyrroline-5-carboxylate reductase [Marinovum sp. 2_MG-2023]|uniref:pyrroline-5-carboxylate reductase n=1 Tax=unclassified Marinovum TaxID=2647166 RepID=UPI0026E3DB99|nr:MULTISPECIES: pyrroline-5-carboxylate reductase [unclassified Marinovum]MDO6729594.1 pyrroline-5-carboxylate reductase [Marinovum sp. 2_MG-2023]MDO6780252.1 pyrroline-5-carboxylate reductase [Marinovum sp. 1_MG-2023]